MTASPTANSRPRLAPPDPTLPKPWKALVDGHSGNIYFWNPETNVTQYRRPTPAPAPATAPATATEALSLPTTTAEERVRQVDRDVRDDDRGPVDGGRACSGAADAFDGSAGGTDRPVARESTGTDSAVRVRDGSVGTGNGSAVLSAEDYRLRHEIKVIGAEVPKPFMTFDSAGFPSELLKEIRQAGFATPTPIQAQSWPIVLQGRDVVAVAKTGSGKTLGYLLPGFILLKRLNNNSKDGPTVLVLSPTRELATQIHDEATKFGGSSRISSACLYGGAQKGPQLRDLARGADIVIATPGRLNDILEMRRVSLHQVSYLVLDEADRMLDMGFEPQIRKIVQQIPSKRQTLMFTATWPKEVRKIASDLLVKPVQVNIGNTDELVANKSITQYVEVISSIEKPRRLERIIRSQEPGSKIIIFCSTKRMCDQLAGNLSRQYGAVAIHGDKSQSERDHTLSDFRNGKSPILVATDVAARGLDIKDIRVVVNYDFPTGVEDYVHRIGRTGRAGATGVAFTFFNEKDSKYASDLVKILEGANQEVPTELKEMARGGGYGGRSRRSGNADNDRSYPYSAVEHDSSYDKGSSYNSMYNEAIETPSNGQGGSGGSFHSRFYGGS